MGSRLGRGSSRYGSAAVFSGPVRRWRKKWVQVPPSPTVTYHSSQSNGGSNPRLFLCRWTPISSTAVPAVSDEPPRKKFRYTPVAVLNEQKKESAKQVDEDSNSETTQTSAGLNFKSSSLYGKLDSIDQIEKKQVPNIVLPRDSYESYCQNDSSGWSAEKQLV